MILNSETFKKEEKILLFLKESIHSLIQLTNGDINLSYDTTVIIYTKKIIANIISMLINFI